MVKTATDRIPNTGSTTISGARAPGGSRRDTRAVGKGLPLGWLVHVFIVALAVLMWWIARDMVSVTRTLRDAGRIEVVLPEELTAQWRIVGSHSLPISIDVAGPTKEINDFAAELDANPGRFGYRYELTESDLTAQPSNSRDQITVILDIGRLKSGGEGGAPVELSVRPVGADRVFQVTLERYVTRAAYVDLGPGAWGAVPGYRFERRVRADFEVEVHGPASLVNAVTDSTGKARLSVIVIDINQVIRNRIKAEVRDQPESVSVADYLKGKTVIASSFDLAPVEGVQIRQANAGPPAAQVPVEFVFKALRDYDNVTIDLPVAVILPTWLSKKGARVRRILDQLSVVMEVRADQRNEFNSQNVHVYVDLSQLTEADVTIEAPAGGSGVFRARPKFQLSYSVVVNAAKVDASFKNKEIDPARYLPIAEIEIEWTE